MLRTTPLLHFVISATLLSGCVSLPSADPGPLDCGKPATYWSSFKTSDGGREYHKGAWCWNTQDPIETEGCPTERFAGPHFSAGDYPQDVGYRQHPCSFACSVDEIGERTATGPKYDQTSGPRDACPPGSPGEYDYYSWNYAGNFDRHTSARFDQPPPPPPASP